MFDHPCNEPHLKNVKHVRKVNPLVTFIFGKRLGSTLRDDSGAPKSGSWPPPRAALVATTTMATCSSYEWSGCYPCSIEIDKLSRWRDFIRQTWIFLEFTWEEKQLSLSCNHVLTPHEGLNCLRRIGIHGSDFSLQKCTREKILQTQQKSIGIKGSYLFQKPSFWVFYVILRDGTSPFIYLHHQFVAHWMCSHWPTTHAALNKFDPEPFHGSLGMEQLETSHRDLSIPHERLWNTSTKREHISDSGRAQPQNEWPQEHITRQETWV